MFETKYYILVTTLDVDESFGHFGNQHPLSLNISVRQQHTKNVAKVEILSSTSKNCHQLQVTNITVAIVIIKIAD